MCKVTLPIFALVEEAAISAVATGDFTQMCGSYLSLGRHCLSLWAQKKTAAQGKIPRNQNNSDFVLSPAEWRNSFYSLYFLCFLLTLVSSLHAGNKDNRACHGLLLLETLKTYSEAGAYRIYCPKNHTLCLPSENEFFFPAPAKNADNHFSCTFSAWFFWPC